MRSAVLGLVSTIGLGRENIGWTECTQSAVYGLSGSRARPAGFDGGSDAAAGAEHALDHCPDRIGGLHDVFQNLVDDVLLEDAQIAIAEQIFLERLQFQASGPGHVADGEQAKVGQAGLGANRGQFRIVDEDLVARKLISPGLNCREGEVESGLGVFVGVGLLEGHIWLLYRERPSPTNLLSTNRL